MTLSLSHDLTSTGNQVISNDVCDGLSSICGLCREILTLSKMAEKSTTTTSRSPPGEKKKRAVLDCGKPVNSTQYDHLRGISGRHSHPHIPEPEVAMIFRTKTSAEPDMNLLESQLRKAKKEVRSGGKTIEISIHWKYGILSVYGKDSRRLTPICWHLCQVLDNSHHRNYHKTSNASPSFY